MSAFEPRPVVRVHLDAHHGHSPARPGGCRCACTDFHPAHGGPTPTCPDPADYGCLAMVVTEQETEGPLPVCLPCYLAIDAAWQ